MSNTPIASYYARTPSAMRAMRVLLSQWEYAVASACYIGCARGEDFYSWYPVAWGTGTDLEWTALDIKMEAVQYTAHCGPDDVKYICHDFRHGLEHYDFVIANRVWTHEMRHDVNGLRTILRSNPVVLFTRGLDTGELWLDQIYQVSGDYHIFGHRDQADDHRSEVKGLAFIRQGVFDFDLLRAPEVKLCQLD